MPGLSTTERSAWILSRSAQHEMQTPSCLRCSGKPQTHGDCIAAPTRAANRSRDMLTRSLISTPSSPHPTAPRLEHLQLSIDESAQEALQVLLGPERQARVDRVGPDASCPSHAVRCTDP